MTSTKNTYESNHNLPAIVTGGSLDT